MLVRRPILLLLSGALVVLGACDTDDGRELPTPGPDQTLTIATTTTTVAATLPAEAAGDDTFEDAPAAAPMVINLPWAGGEVIPVEYTCEDADQSPAVSWSELPEGTVEVAVVVTDLTAGEYVHWIAFGLDPALGGVERGAAATLPSQAVNGFGNATYGGPCPPTGTHTYRFTVYALGQQLEIPAGGPADEALAAIGAATLDSTSSTGTFTAT